MYYKIKKAMKEQKMTCGKLARLTGINSRTLLYALESEERFYRTSWKNGMAIAEALSLIPKRENATEPVIIANGKKYEFSKENFAALEWIIKRVQEKSTAGVTRA